MITFIYPKDDWTAAETLMKMQALAASQGYSVYATPKNTKRNLDDIKLRLGKTRYAIFLAIDARDIDKDTEFELSFLKDRDIEIYCVIPGELKNKLLDYCDAHHVYIYDRTDPQTFIKSLEVILKDIRAKEEGRPGQASKSGAIEAIILLAILGVLMFFLWLLFGKER